MPAINSNPVRLFIPAYLSGNHNIFFDTGNQSLFAFSLTFDDQVMLPHGRGAIPVSKEGNWSEFQSCRLVNIIHHFPGGQETIKAVGYPLSRIGRNTDARPVITGTDTQVVRCDIKNSLDHLAGDAIREGNPDWYKLPEKWGQVARKDFLNYEGITGGPLHGCCLLVKS